MTPIDRELLAPSLAQFGKSTTLPAEAYTDESVFSWEQEHFFDRSWVLPKLASVPMRQDPWRPLGARQDQESALGQSRADTLRSGSRGAERYARRFDSNRDS